MTISLTRRGQTAQATAGTIRRATIVFTAGNLTKSFVSDDGFTEANLKNTSTKHIWIEAVRGRDCTIKMYETAGADAVTTTEAMTQLGPDLKAGVFDNVLEPAGRFFGLTDDRHLTFVADKPCAIEVTVLIES